MPDAADHVLVISACGDFIYTNSPFGSSPTIMSSFDGTPQGMCFSLSTSAAWSGLESVFWSFLCGLNILHTSHMRCLILEMFSKELPGSYNGTI